MSILRRLQKLSKSFRFRLFAIFTIITTLITIILTALFVEHEIRSYRLQASEKALLLASFLANNIRLPLYAEDKQTLERLAAETAQKPDVVGIVISNYDGKALVEWEKRGDTTPANTQSVMVNVDSGDLTPSADAALTGNPATSGKAIGTVRLALNSSDLPKKTRELVIFSATMALFFWLMVISLNYIALKKATRSFNALMQGVKRIGKGDYSVRIATESDDEPGRAAMAINNLAASLENREAENRRLQEELFNAMKLEVREERKQLMAKLIQTNRMTSLGLLVSSMAHEINNPNSAIRLAGQYLNKAWKDTMPILEGVAREEGDFSIGGIPFNMAGEEVARSGMNIIRNTERIERVIKNLRAYSIGDRNVFQADVNVNQVINDALAVIRIHGHHGNFTIALEPDPDLPLITGNGQQLEQVIINLLLNAVQAMPNGTGTIKIVTVLDQKSGEVRISVADEGEGILPEHLERIYEPFFSTRIDNGGSGLGLYISNFIVSEHQGRFEVESERDKGTIFTISLPLSQQAS